MTPSSSEALKITQQERLLGDSWRRMRSLLDRVVLHGASAQHSTTSCDAAAQHADCCHCILPACRVKFWIISNYMSPHHKRIVPAMAEKYGFDYEFVTYKWPHWLHKQTDKQRIIWAYKILFLDVLFPLDVPRMIFVDSDQVVRTDLAKLYNMDLKVRADATALACV